MSTKKQFDETETYPMELIAHPDGRATIKCGSGFRGYEDYQQANAAFNRIVGATRKAFNIEVDEPNRHPV